MENKNQVQEFLNFDEVYEGVKSIYEDVIENFSDSPYQDMLYDYVEDFAKDTAEGIVRDMQKYTHMDDTSMTGNFCDIKFNFEYDYEKNDLPEVLMKGDGRFSTIVKRADNGELSEEELSALQSWTLEWFYKAFGTFGLKYNFSTFCGDTVYSLEEEDENERRLRAEEEAEAAKQITEA